MVMLTATDNVKNNFANISFIATSLVLLLILFIRVTRGLDLTDEMQYYGEIKGLIETGKLFSNDLFIQQSVYILLYPAFYIYHLLFNFEGFVVFGRLIMAVISISVFLYAYQRLLEFNFSSLVASLTASTLTFAIPYHGIFAPSYNTISQVFWIVFTFRFFEWKQRGPVFWGAIPVITAFAHPISAVMMSLLVLLRLSFDRDFRQVAKVMLALLSGGLVAIPLILYFATPHEYLASLSFSSGYGVGAAFFANKSQPATLIVIYVMFGACLLFWKRFQAAPFALLLSIFVAVAIVLFSTGLAVGAYSSRVVYVLSFLSAVAYGWLSANTFSIDKKLRQQINWLVGALLAYATALGVTSSNGIGQSTGAFMVGLPFLLGLAVSYGANKEGRTNSLLNTVCVVLVFTLFVVQWGRYPYREVSWWQVSQPIKSVPEYRFISTSSDRSAFIRRMKHELEPMVQDKRTLIISEYPGLYFAFGTHPETCMLYMHSLTSDKSEEVLLNCLNKKKPDIVIDLLADDDIAKGDSRIKMVLHSYYAQQGYNCTNEALKFNSITKNNPEHLRYSTCKHVGAKKYNLEPVLPL